MIKNKSIDKKLCLVWLIAAFVYGSILPFCWGNDPLDPLGTLSILCAAHKPFFWLWVLLCGGANLININYMYKRYDYDNKALKILSVVTFLAACGIAATLGHPVDSWNLKRIIHWVVTGLYVAGLGVCIGFFGLMNKKKNKQYLAVFFCVILIVVIFVAWLLIIGKSGIHEMVSYALLQILLFLLNFTDVFGLLDRVKTKNLN